MNVSYLETCVILLAEDDPGHARLIQRNLKRGGITNAIVHVSDGQEALDFVLRNGAYADRPPSGPLLMLLDINMPRLDGVEVLRRLKADEATSSIPVIMLTTTEDPREVERCYALGCSIYITKPVAYENFVDAMTRLSQFLAIIKLPEAEGSARTRFAVEPSAIVKVSPTEASAVVGSSVAEQS